jgi:hypothetical protein
MLPKESFFGDDLVLQKPEELVVYQRAHAAQALERLTPAGGYETLA